MGIKTSLIWVALSAGAGIASAQEATTRTIAPEVWEKAVAGLDYSGEQPPQERPSPPAQQIPPSTPLPSQHPLADIVQYVVIAGVVALVVWLVIASYRAPKNRRLDKRPANNAVSEEGIEREWGVEVLSERLQQALQRGDYNQAVRLHFLLTVHCLSAAGLLQWAQEKTNRQYVRELRGWPQAELFAKAARLFERARYSQQPIQRLQYETEIAPLLEHLCTTARR